MRVTISGDEEVIAKLNRLSNKIPDIIGNSLYLEVQKMMAESKGTECPKKTGDLRRSGHVDDPIVTKSMIAVVAGYNKAYAARQHEELGYEHAIGKSKYLEDPAKRLAVKLPALLSQRVKARMGALI